MADRKRRKSHSQFVSTELANDDQALLTDIPIPICTLRNENCSTENAGYFVCFALIIFIYSLLRQSSSVATPLPKLIIRFPKRENSLNDRVETMEFAPHKKRRKKKCKDIDWTETSEYHGMRSSEKRHRDKRHKKERKEHKRHKRYPDEEKLTLNFSFSLITKF